MFDCSKPVNRRYSSLISHSPVPTRPIFSRITAILVERKFAGPLSLFRGHPSRGSKAILTRAGYLHLRTLLSLLRRAIGFLSCRSSVSLSRCRCLLVRSILQGLLGRVLPAQKFFFEEVVLLASQLCIEATF